MPANRYESPVVIPENGSPLIRMRGITKTFHTAAGGATVLKNIDVDLLQGQFVSVVGRSGSGKSTLVNMITGIDRPTAGTVEIGGLPVLHMPESEMAVWRGKHLGIVFQFFQLLPMLTLVENVMLPMDFCNIYPPSRREARALELLRRVGLEELAHMLPGAVSGGQQQSTAVARALATDPPILIADEPTGNLDSNTAEQVMQIFEELAAQGKTILIVTHDRMLAQRTSRRLLISDGELVNECLAETFHTADHTLLLQASKQASTLTLAAEMPIPSAENAQGQVYLVCQGELLATQRGETRLYLPGNLVDPLEIRSTLTAGEQGVQLLKLPRSSASTLLPEQIKPASGGEATGERSTHRYGWLRRPRRAK